TSRAIAAADRATWTSGSRPVTRAEEASGCDDGVRDRRRAAIALLDEEEAARGLERHLRGRAAERGLRIEVDGDVDVVDEARLLRRREADGQHLARARVDPRGAERGVVGRRLGRELEEEAIRVLCIYFLHAKRVARTF